MYHNLHRKQYLFMKNFRMPLRFYSWCSTRGAHGNLAQSYPAHVAYGGKYPAGAGFGITGRKAEKAGKKLKKWLAFLERECYTVKRTFVNAFFFCAQKTGFFHHEQAQECVLAKKEKGGFT